MFYVNYISVKLGENKSTDLIPKPKFLLYNPVPKRKVMLSLVIVVNITSLSASANRPANSYWSTNSTIHKTENILRNDTFRFFHFSFAVSWWLTPCRGPGVHLSTPNLLAPLPSSLASLLMWTWSLSLESPSASCL